MQKIRRWIIGVVISAITLLIVFWGVKPERMLELLSGARLVYLFPVEAALIAGLIARSVSWRVLLDQRLTLKKVFSVVNIGYLLNTVMPLRLGELGRAYLVGAEKELSVAKALGTITIERLLDTLISLSALLISLPMIIIPSWAGNLTWVVGISFVGILSLSLVIIYRKKWVSDVLQGLSRFGLGSLSVITEEFIAGLESLIQPTKLLRAGLWSLLAWICVWIQMWLLLTILGAPINIALLLFVPSVVAFGSAFPPSPGALGIFEISAVAGLLVFGYERETALSVAILWHGMQLLSTAVFGGWGLSREGHSLLRLVDKAQSVLQNRKVSDTA